MKKEAKKSTTPAAKPEVKVKDLAPKKDAKGGKTAMARFGGATPKFSK